MDRIFSSSLNVVIAPGGRDTSPTLKGTSGSLSPGIKLPGFATDGDPASCAEVRKAWPLLRAISLSSCNFALQTLGSRVLYEERRRIQDTQTECCFWFSLLWANSERVPEMGTTVFLQLVSGSSPVLLCSAVHYEQYWGCCTWSTDVTVDRQRGCFNFVFPCITV